ncbi:hypothetical protein BKA82DRAFT_999661 [Pisolithus tinctorius]|nr:hypothetical protein BKA82DRAFT_999661 [Pisolithus tinctorius]
MESFHWLCLAHIGIADATYSLWLPATNALDIRGVDRDRTESAAVMEFSNVDAQSTETTYFGTTTGNPTCNLIGK